MTRPVLRWHKTVVAVIVIVGLVRGLFWVLVIEVTSPVDEAQHTDYVISLATRGRPPIVGIDTLHPDLLRLLKSSSTREAGQLPVAVEDPASWGAVAQSYEGMQPPLYYALLAPVYRAVRGVGMPPALFALRLASLLVALTAVPLTYLLGRELFPCRPAVWLGGPLLLVFVQGFNANLAIVTNDALIVPLGVAALLPTARAIRRGPSWQQAIATGVLGGLALLTKATAGGVVVIVALGTLLAAWQHRTRGWVLAGWPAVAGAVGAVLIAPWVVWNTVVYGAPNAAAQVHAILGPMLPRAPVTTLSGLRTHVEAASRGFWDLEWLLASPWNTYTVPWIAAFVLGVAGGLAVVLWRGRRQAAARLGWLAVAAPIAFLAMLTVIVGISGPVGLMVGRHLYSALPAAMLALAGGIGLVLPARWAVVTLLGVVALVTGAEPPSVHRYIDATYISEVVPPNLVPAVDQGWNDEWVPGEPVQLDLPCKAPAFTLTFADLTPPSLLLVGGASASRLEELGHPSGFRVARYSLSPSTVKATVEVPQWAKLGWSRADRTPYMAMGRRGGDPVAQILCPVGDPEAVRFEQTFDPQHPDAIYYGSVRAWPVAWAWVARTVAVAAFLGVLVRSRRGQASTSRRNLPKE